jgi:hypothetical protein
MTAALPAFARNVDVFGQRFVGEDVVGQEDERHSTTIRAHSGERVRPTRDTR